MSLLKKIKGFCKPKIKPAVVELKKPTSNYYYRQYCLLQAEKMAKEIERK